MKIIKHSGLIAESAATGSKIVTRTEASAKALYDEARSRNVVIPYPITFDDFIHQNYDWRTPGLLIADADDLLRVISRAPVKGIAFSED